MANGIIIPVQRYKTVTCQVGNNNSFTPTAVNYGHIATLTGVTGLSQDKVVGITVMQASLTPASNLIFGFYNSNLYIAASQSCTMSGSMTLNVTYID